jgi:hypothetical protein
MTKRFARLLAAVSTILAIAVPAAVAAPVLAPPGAPTTSPSIGSVGSGPEDGADLTCTTGSWFGAGTITYAFQWLRNGTPITDATTDNYVVQAADVGQNIVCRVTATDSAGPPGTDADSSTETPSPAPATIGITQYGLTVNWRHLPSMLTVGADLRRNGTIVSSVPNGNTDGTGLRDGTLSPNNAPADARDTIDFTFGAFPTLTSTNLFGQWESVVVPANGSDIKIVNCVDCQNVTVDVVHANNVAEQFFLSRDPQDSCSAPPPGFPILPGAPGTPGVGCDYSLRGMPPPLIGFSILPTDRVTLRVSLRPLGSTGRLDETFRAQMPGQPAPPRCEANRTIAQVVCSNVMPSQSYQMVKRSGVVDEPGSVISAGAGTTITQPFSSLKAGDVVVLKLSSNAACTTTAQDSCLSVVHVHNISTNIVDGLASGGCQTGQWIRKEDPGASPFLCQGGAFSNVSIAQAPVKRINSDDDLGGGATVIAVADVVNTTPLAGESMPPRFKAYADAGDGLPWPVSLDITPRGGGASLFQTTNVDVSSGAQVCSPTPATTPCASGTPGLAEGRYDAAWLLTSAHVGDLASVDTSRISTKFVVQQSMVGPTGPNGTNGSNGTNGTNGTAGAVGPTGPNGTTGANGTNGANGADGANGGKGDTGAQGPVGAQGPGGVAGAQGPAGARGPAGRDARVTCKPKGTKRVKVTCTVRFTTAAAARTIRARMSRRGKVYATGKGVARNGKVSLRMKARRAIPAGKYRLTVVTVSRRGSAVTTHTEVTVSN